MKALSKEQVTAIFHSMGLVFDPAALELLEAHGITTNCDEAAFRAAVRHAFDFREEQLDARAMTAHETIYGPVCAKGVRRHTAPADVARCVLPWRTLQSPAGDVLRVLLAAQEPGADLPDRYLSWWQQTPWRERHALLQQAMWLNTKQVFRISPAFTDMLGATDISALRPTDLAAPYENFWLALPQCTRQMEDDISGGSLALAGIGVGITQAGVLLESGETLPGPSLDLLPWCAPSTQNPHDDLYRTLRIPLALLLSSTPEAKVTKWFGTDAVFYFRLAVNFLAYLNASDAEQHTAEEMKEWAAQRQALAEQRARQGKKKRARLQRREARIPDFTLTDIARSIRADGLGGQGTSPRRHWVRGHWVRQPCGPQRSVRRLQWRRPHLRGGAPEDETGVRVYGSTSPENTEAP